jgi:hypothetical protein
VDNFVAAHAGYGLFLTTDRTVTAIGRSFKKVQYEYSVNAVGAASALVEGGMEFTALEDGNLIASASGKIWRKRVCGPPAEDAFEQEGPFAVFEPNELAFTMRPGRGYTFNVGAWVFSDTDVDVGFASARSLIKADILAITIER